MALAREFYRRADRERLFELGSGTNEEGWSAGPNLHFSFVATNLFYPGRRLPPSVHPGAPSNEAYFDYWKAKRDAGGICQRVVSEASREAEFTAIFDEFLAAGQVIEADRAAFDEAFTRTRRRSLNICPGWEICYGWPKEIAMALDQESRFAAELRRHRFHFSIPQFLNSSIHSIEAVIGPP